MAVELSVKDADQSSKQKKIPKFDIKFIPERCKGCTYCIEFCPKGVLKIADEINSKGYHLPIAAHLDACIGCKLCELICPDFCIFVEKNLEK